MRPAPAGKIFSRVTLSRYKPYAPIAIAVLTTLAVLYVLFAWVDFASGYGSARIDILQFAKWIWDSTTSADGQKDWQHCYLVPFAFGFLVYVQRKRLAELPIRGSWVGLAVVILSLLFYWVGFKADNVYLGYASFQIIIAGLILWFFGLQWMWTLAFAWAFLVFIYPLPFLDNWLALPLRLVMSEASVHALNILGIGAVKSGSSILSASDPVSGIPIGARFSVDVAAACSGIRSLFALMMVSALFAHLTQKGLVRQGLLFLSSIPLAVFANLIRILMLTIGTLAMGAEVAIGTNEKPSFFHELAGYIVFAVGLGGLFGVSWLLNQDFVALKNRLLAALRHAAPAQAAPKNQAPASRKPRQDEY
ncbi:hypothetical protein DB345_08250 [Spartobacteria bacterium LR76]|nr:hypothetical protein DB345_08250 [Spartobacteria bacterium LR76]